MTLFALQDEGTAPIKVNETGGCGAVGILAGDGPLENVGVLGLVGRDERDVYARYFQQTPASEFLHDLKTDPDERANLATHPDHQQTLEAMRQRGDARGRAGGRFLWLAQH